MNEFLMQLISRSLWSLPYLIIWGVGLGIFVTVQTKNKSATKLAVAAFSIFIVSTILSTLIQTWLITFQNDSVIPLSTSLPIAGAISTLLNITAWILLLIAMQQLLKSSTDTK